MIHFIHKSENYTILSHKYYQIRTKIYNCLALIYGLSIYYDLFFLIGACSDGY